MLTANWILEGTIDFEYKKYILLAYLKKVREKFEHHELYPHLSELIKHYKNLRDLSNSKELLIEDMPKQISGLDLKSLMINYKRIAIDDELMQEIFDVIEYAVPKMRTVLNDGMERYEYVEKNISLEPVGLIPLYKKEGYFFIDDHAGNSDIYRYRVSTISGAEENFVAINTELVSNEQLSIANHYQQIKLKLIDTFRELPNPAVYYVNCSLKLPVKEAILPVTERLLLRQLAA